MILIMAKYHENLLKVSPLSLLFIVKFLSSLETKMVLKIPNETFLRITRYHGVLYWCARNLSPDVTSTSFLKRRNGRTYGRTDGRTDGQTLL